MALPAFGHSCDEAWIWSWFNVERVAGGRNQGERSSLRSPHPNAPSCSCPGRIPRGRSGQGSWFEGQHGRIRMAVLPDQTRTSRVAAFRASTIRHLGSGINTPSGSICPARSCPRGPGDASAKEFFDEDVTSQKVSSKVDNI